MEDIIEPLVDKNEYPMLIDRMKSTFIDFLVLIMLMYLCSVLLDKYQNAPDWLAIVMFVSVWLVYDPLFTTLGCTLGNYLIGLRVRQVDDKSKRINIFQAVFRYVLKMSLGWISFLTINGNKEKRAIHDFAAGSVVVKNRSL